MSRAGFLLLAAILAAPVLAYLVYFLARGLGFLEPPRSREQELKRAVLAAVYALLVFFPVFVFGAERRWPPAWLAFGVVCGAALVYFSVSGVTSAAALWKLRHSDPGFPAAGSDAEIPIPEFRGRDSANVGEDRVRDSRTDFPIPPTPGA
jgi:hypothetical protein